MPASPPTSTQRAAARQQLVELASQDRLLALPSGNERQDAGRGTWDAWSVADWDWLNNGLRRGRTVHLRANRVAAECA